MPFDLLYWNSDATRMPAANHSFYLRNCYLENELDQGRDDDRQREARSEEGQGADLQSRDPRGPHRAGEVGLSRLEVFRRAGASSCWPARATSPAWSIRRPSRNTSTGPASAASGDDLDNWIANATEHPGSWWPDWLAVAESIDPQRLDAHPPGGPSLPPIEDAPGSYVKVQELAG